jgi:serine/threonine protein phosphatase 1
MEGNMKKYFIFSDVHGEYDALLEALEKSKFDSNNKEHILVSLGDSFDRGEQNDKVLEFLFNYFSKGRLLLVEGNHDVMLKDYLFTRGDGKNNNTWNLMNNGLGATISDFTGIDQNIVITHSVERKEIIEIDTIKNKCPEIYKLLDNMQDKIVLGNYVLTHAGFSKYFDVNTEKDYWKVNNWANTERFIEQFPEWEKYDREKIYVFGHWHTRKLYKKFYKTESFNDEIFRHKNFIGIDGTTNLTYNVHVLVLTELEDGNIKEIKDE